MNYQKRNFEERLKKADLSDEQKSRYRRINLELLKLRIVNGINKVTKWIEQIKPLVVVGKEDKDIVFNGTTDETHKRIVTNISGDKNILTSLISGEAVLKPLKCKLNRLCVFSAYLPNSTNNPQLPDLSAINVLRQMPENVPVGKAQYFEVIFNSSVPEDDYDEILQAHKVRVILYNEACNPLERLRAKLRQLPDEKKKSKQDEQPKQIVLKKTDEKSEKKKNPYREIPQRQY